MFVQEEEEKFFKKNPRIQSDAPSNIVLVGAGNALSPQGFIHRENIHRYGLHTKQRKDSIQLKQVIHDKSQAFKVI